MLYAFPVPRGPASESFAASFLTAQTPGGSCRHLAVAAALALHLLVAAALWLSSVACGQLCTLQTDWSQGKPGKGTQACPPAETLPHPHIFTSFCLESHKESLVPPRAERVSLGHQRLRGMILFQFSCKIVECHTTNTFPLDIILIVLQSENGNQSLAPLALGFGS